MDNELVTIDQYAANMTAIKKDIDSLQKRLDTLEESFVWINKLYLASKFDREKNGYNTV